MLDNAEEHLLTVKMVLERVWTRNPPSWMVGLDESKAFDRVCWPELWRALRELGVSEHMIWLLFHVYANQVSQLPKKQTKNLTSTQMYSKDAF